MCNVIVVETDEVSVELEVDDTDEGTVELGVDDADEGTVELEVDDTDEGTVELGVKGLHWESISSWYESKFSTSILWLNWKQLAERWLGSVEHTHM